MKKIIMVLLIVSIMFLSWCSMLSKKSITRWYSYVLNDESPSIITCELSLSAVVSSVVWSDQNTLEAKVTKEDNPMKVTFVWLDTDNPKMKWNVWESELTKIDNWSSVYLIEKTFGGNINIYTFFPKEKILLMSKQYNFWWPFWLQMVWFCE